MRYGYILVFIMTQVGCREPEKTAFPDDVPYFDASVGPDAGVALPNEACVSDREYTFNNSFSPSMGGEVSVDVEVAHFSSFYCIHCADFASDSRGLWDRREDFREHVPIYFRHMNWGYRHRAAVAAANQGEAHFWALHDYIYSRMLTGVSTSDKQLRNFVKDELGLSMERFDEDVEAPETYSFLLWEIDEGLAVGVQGTPTVFVCGQPLYTRDMLEVVVDEYLEM